MFHMIANGEHKIPKVLAIMPDGKTGAPCGACLKLMAQLMSDDCPSVEIMLDCEKKKLLRWGADFEVVDIDTFRPEERERPTVLDFAAM